MTRGIERLRGQVTRYAAQGRLEQAQDALRALLRWRETHRADLEGAIACAECAAQVMASRAEDEPLAVAALCWEAGYGAERDHPRCEAVAAGWTRTLCHLTAAYGVAERLQDAVRCEEVLGEVARRFPQSEDIQYWNAQAQFELVAAFTRRGYLQPLPGYLEELRRICAQWPDYAAYWSLYAMALANATAAYAQTQHIGEVRRQVEMLRQAEEQYPQAAEIAKAYARGVQQAAWYCGELVAPVELFDWATRLVVLLERPDVRRECGSLAVAELGVYSVHLARSGETAYASKLLREAFSLMEKTAVDADEIPMIVETFRNAAAELRPVDPELARMAERRSGRLLC